MAAKHMPITKNILLGAVGFRGTAAPWMTVKAGVRSCTLALAAWYCVIMVL